MRSQNQNALYQHKSSCNKIQGECLEPMACHNRNFMKYSPSAASQRVFKPINIPKEHKESSTN